MRTLPLLSIGLGFVVLHGTACTRRDRSASSQPARAQPAATAAAGGHFSTGTVEGHPKPPPDKPDEADRSRNRPEWYPTGQPDNPYPPGTVIPVTPPGLQPWPGAAAAPAYPQQPMPVPGGGLQPMPAPGQGTTYPGGGLQPIPAPGTVANAPDPGGGLQPIPAPGGNPQQPAYPQAPPTGGLQPIPAPGGLQPAPAVAPAAPGTGQGTTIRDFQGTLGQGAAPGAQGRFQQQHTVNLRRGQRVIANLRGSFDTFLRVEPPVGEAMENDDVSREDLNSRVEFITSIDGNYRMTVTSYAPGMTGTYTLHVEAAAPGAGIMVTGGGSGPSGGADGQTGAGGAITPGTPVNEYLSPGDTTSGGRYVRAYRLDGRQGDIVSLRLQSTAFDTTLALIGPDGHRWFNDDASQGDLNSALSVTLPQAGSYRVEVSSYRQSATGPFSLSVTASGRPTVGPGGTPQGGLAGRQGQGSMYGIFVGITDYGPRGTLFGCADDARQLAQAYISAHLGSQAQFIVLTDAEATTGAVQQAFTTMASRVGPQDVFMFFHSGHGGRHSAQEPGGDADGHVETIVMRDGELNSRQLSGMFDSIRADVNMLALDSCFSGGFERAFGTRPNRFGMYSSEEDVVSNVAQTFQAGGYLSYFLRRGVTEGDHNHDGTLRAGELADYLYQQFAQNLTRLGTEDGSGTSTWQHLVLHREGIALNDLLWRFPSVQ